MSKCTRLNVPSALEEFAKLHGAYLIEGIWYFDGDVPMELDELVAREIRPVAHQIRLRNFHPEVVPQCDLCGCHMVLKPNRRSSVEFWSCSRFPICRGSKSFDTDMLVRASDLALSSLVSSAGEDCSAKKALPNDVLEWVAKITARAEKLFVHPGAAMRWLEMPKVALGNKSPLHVMVDLSGCAHVERLLDERFEE